jgi:hypothetical protein
MEKSIGGGTAPLNYIYLLKNNYLRYSAYTKDTDHSEEAAYSKITDAYNAEKGKAMALVYSKNPLLKNKRASDEYCEKLEAIINYFVSDGNSNGNDPTVAKYKEIAKNMLKKDLKWGLESVEINITGNDISVKNNGKKISNDNKQMMINKSTTYENILKRLDEIVERLKENLNDNNKVLNGQTIDYWMKEVTDLKAKFEKIKSELAKINLSVTDSEGKSIKNDELHRRIQKLSNGSQYVREINKLSKDINELIKAEWSTPPESYYSGKLFENIIYLLPSFALEASEELIGEDLKKTFSEVNNVKYTAQDSEMISDFYTKAKEGKIKLSGSGLSTTILDSLSYKYSSASKADIVYEYDDINVAEETFKNFKAGISAKNLSSDKGDFKIVTGANMASFFMQMTGGTDFGWQWANFFGVHNGPSVTHPETRKGAFDKYKNSLRAMFMSLSMYYALSGDIDNKNNPANYLVIWRGNRPKAYSIAQIYEKIITEQTKVSVTGMVSNSLYNLKYTGFGNTDKSFRNFDFKDEVAKIVDYKQNDSKFERYKKGVQRSTNIYSEIKNTKLTALINQKILNKLDGSL